MPPTRLTRKTDDEHLLDRERWECVIIELNPYAKTTEAGLFNWGRDEELLKTGSEPVELRVHKKAIVSGNFMKMTLETYETYAKETPWDKLLEMEGEHAKKAAATKGKGKEGGKKTSCILM